MITLPEEHELIGFFECEPELLDSDVKPWCYNEVKFSTVRGEDEIAVKIYASFGEITINWKKSGIQILHMKLIDVQHLTVEMQHRDEFMAVVGSYSNRSMLLKLRLKPLVAIEFEQQCEY